ncbi:MAG: TatD family hydrolase [Candidatus Heimdallarchaeota archaeon]
MQLKVKYFDVHCHLHEGELFHELEAILIRARANKVNIIAVSMDLTSSKSTLDITRQYDDVYAAVGLHPWNVKTPSQVKLIGNLLQENQDEITAIGEVGLDHTFVKDPRLWIDQEFALEQLIALSKEFSLPLITHGKGFETGLVEYLIGHEAEDVVLHWFGGSETAIKSALKAGYYFSITPAVLFQKKLRKVVELAPLDRLMLESDGPVRYNKLLGEPSIVSLVASEIARIKKVSEEMIARTTTKTAKQFFRIS